MERLPSSLSRGRGADILWARLALSSSRRTLPGVLRVGPGALADELGWPAQALSKCLRELERTDLIGFDREARVLHVRGLISADPPRSMSSVIACARDYLELPACAVREAILAECNAAMANHALVDDWRRMVGVVAAHPGADAGPLDGVHVEPLSELHSEVQSTHACTRARPFPSPDPEPRPEPGAASGTQTAADARSRFSELWTVYPKKRDELPALEAYSRFPAEQHDLLMAAVSAQAHSPDWLEANGKFIPRLARWLESGDWQRVEFRCPRCTTSHTAADRCAPSPCRDCGLRHPPEHTCSQRRAREVREEDRRETAAYAAEHGLSLENAEEERRAQSRSLFRGAMRRLGAAVPPGLTGPSSDLREAGGKAVETG